MSVADGAARAACALGAAAQNLVLWDGWMCNPKHGRGWLAQQHASKAAL